ncbi:MAG: squalene synthase [Chloroflexi bacterium]|nr:MAG: squalene synthase [Chloroflexota bacterium]
MMDSPKDTRLSIYPAHYYLSALPQVVHVTSRSSRSEPLSVAGAYATCRAITREHSKSFFLASRLLPPAKRLAMEALYAFCRTSDDTVDISDNAGPALAHWVAQINLAVPPADQPVLLAWNDTCERYQLPCELANELLAGVAMDLSIQRYETFAELWVYCYRVASVVGLLSMRIIGHQPGAEAYAIRLGIALQLTNILRDIGEDARRGRIYLPQEDLRRFGLSAADILNGVRDDRFRALMTYEIERAEHLYRASWPGVVLLHQDGQMAVATAALLYRGILQKIVDNDFDVFTRRAHLSTAEKLLLLPQIYRRLQRLREGTTALV